MTLASELEIQSAYSGGQKAAGYVQQRFSFPLMEMLHRRQVDAVNTIFRINRPTSALEVAPGPGRLTRDLHPSATLTCLEFNDGMIDEGKAACDPAVRWVQGNAFELPFETGQFDFAYTFRFIRHFHRADRERLYAQIHRVLQPGGTLIFDAVNKVVSQPLREAHPEDYPIYDKLYENLADLRTELREAGFEFTTAQPVQRRYRAQYRAQVLLGPRSSTLCRAVIRGLERLPGGSPLEWIVTCRRA